VCGYLSYRKKKKGMRSSEEGVNLVRSIAVGLVRCKDALPEKKNGYSERMETQKKDVRELDRDSALRRNPYTTGIECQEA